MSVLISLLISVALFSISEGREVLLNMMDSLTPGIWLLILLISLVIQYIVLALCFGWFSKNAFKAIQAKQQLK